MERSLDSLFLVNKKMGQNRTFVYNQGSIYIHNYSGFVVYATDVQ